MAESIGVDVESLHHDRRWGERKPLSRTSSISPDGRKAKDIHLTQTDVLERVCLEDLQEVQRRVPRVLDIMSVRRGDIPDVACLEVERVRGALGGKECDARGAFEEEGPLVLRGVPVQFAHRAGLDRDLRHCGCGGDVEGVRVDDLHGAAGVLRWCELRGGEDVRGGNLALRV